MAKVESQAEGLYCLIFVSVGEATIIAKPSWSRSWASSPTLCHDRTKRTRRRVIGTGGRGVPRRRGRLPYKRLRNRTPKPRWLSAQQAWRPAPQALEKTAGEGW